MKVYLALLALVVPFCFADLFQSCHKDRVSLCPNDPSPPYSEHSVFTSKCFIEHLADLSEACRDEMVAYAQARSLYDMCHEDRVMYCPSDPSPPYVDKALFTSSCFSEKYHDLSGLCQLRMAVWQYLNPSDNHHHHNHHHHSGEDEGFDEDNHRHHNHHHHNGEEDSSDEDNHHHHNHHHHSGEDEGSDEDNHRHHNHHHHNGEEDSSDEDNHRHHKHHHHNSGDDDHHHHNRHHHHGKDEEECNGHDRHHNHHSRHHHTFLDSVKELREVVAERFHFLYENHPLLFVLVIMLIMGLPPLLLLLCCCSRTSTSDSDEAWKSIELSTVDSSDTDEDVEAPVSISLGNLSLGTANAQYVPVQVVYGNHTEAV